MKATVISCSTMPIYLHSRNKEHLTLVWWTLVLHAIWLDLFNINQISNKRPCDLIIIIHYFLPFDFVHQPLNLTINKKNEQISS